MKQKKKKNEIRVTAVKIFQGVASPGRVRKISSSRLKDENTCVHSFFFSTQVHSRSYKLTRKKKETTAECFLRDSRGVSAHRGLSLEC